MGKVSFVSSKENFKGMSKEQAARPSSHKKGDVFELEASEFVISGEIQGEGWTGVVLKAKGHAKTFAAFSIVDVNGNSISEDLCAKREGLIPHPEKLLVSVAKGDVYFSPKASVPPAPSVSTDL